MFEGEHDQAAPQQEFESAFSVALQSADEVGSVAGQNGHGGLRLSVMQREFARQYVLTGANATKAAALAGYGDPSKSGFKNLLNPAVLHEVKRLAIIHTEALLPLAIRQLVEIMCDERIDGKARVSAAVALLDRGGMRPKADPTTAVQVNVQINGSQAQAAIADVWRAREQRLGAQMSDIAGGMSDIPPTLITHEPQPPAASFAPAAGAGQGGAVGQGPVAGPVPIPPPSSEHSSKSAGGASG